MTISGEVESSLGAVPLSSGVFAADSVDTFPCTYCNVAFVTRDELKLHCTRDLHKKKVSSDDGRKWQYRPPPRGLVSDEYTKCPRYLITVLKNQT